MQRYFIYLSYNGKNYCGWQIQPNGNTVQAELEKAIAILIRKPISIVGAGRTDAGVHAKLMVAHFDSEAIPNKTEFVERLNRITPTDISITKVEEVKSVAHARFDATSRTYKYYVTDQKDIFRSDISYKLHGKIDFELMNLAAKTLFDYTDFTSFSKLHTDVMTNNCKIMHAEWTFEDGLWVFTIQADRFLRNMVRAIVGTLLDVGRGKIGIDEFRRIIEAKDRSKAGFSVPAHALFLIDITY
ncbi:MAG: tRNA pseudouridine(38-40) synthase TruA [Bacteroidales bacterium]|nr:tRNA pseudouridine(38-40) synthase TruA [Bacteroidales bacterium]